MIEKRKRTMLLAATALVTLRCSNDDPSCGHGFCDAASDAAADVMTAPPDAQGFWGVIDAPYDGVTQDAQVVDSAADADAGDSD